ncbi:MULTISPECIES: DUF1572 family protein [Paenibacillus]|uniref:DUF1572 family protein n=1 Tax=Paenibacillus TaxID=44249 RepID=UPI00038FA7F4|nr:MULTISPECIES: DUF1572 family protein [Paenibacillus]KKC47079.1 hypothetical protein VE23_07855 [Paenibacillus sp. D9]CDN43739.1 Uncharacterized protein BN871_DK_00110 [Paenibacillus sp. P22]
MSSQQLGSHLLQSCLATFESQKKLADRSLGQIDDGGLFWTPSPESNSIAVIVRHLSGNLKSRWTDFLTADGEKPDRNRDGEFELPPGTDRQAVLSGWEEGWAALRTAFDSLQPEDLLGTVLIRGERHTVVEAIQRQVAHFSHHVGQIVYAAKAYRSGDWHTLSIPRGGSDAFNEAKRSGG